MASLAGIAKESYGLPSDLATTIEEQFKKLDKDSSGTVTEEEALAFFKNPVYKNKFEAKYDANKDGKVTAAEFLSGFVTARYGLEPSVVQDLKKKFDAINVDGTGVITEADLKEYLKRGGQEDVSLVKYDVDANGDISWTEFLKVASKK